MQRVSRANGFSLTKRCFVTLDGLVTIYIYIHTCTQRIKGRLVYTTQSACAPVQMILETTCDLLYTIIYIISTMKFYKRNLQ